MERETEIGIFDQFVIGRQESFDKYIAAVEANIQVSSPIAIEVNGHLLELFHLFSQENGSVVVKNMNADANDIAKEFASALNEKTGKSVRAYFYDGIKQSRDLCVLKPFLKK